MQRKLLVAAIFLGSFISFALEPMIGRALLPVFGGTPMVWVTCLGAFQILMVGGYFYGEVRSAECEVRGAPDPSSLIPDPLLQREFGRIVITGTMAWQRQMRRPAHEVALGVWLACL